MLAAFQVVVTFTRPEILLMTLPLHKKGRFLCETYFLCLRKSLYRDSRTICGF